MSADILGSLLQSNDPRTVVAQLFTRMGGRELSPDALQCISFLQSQGSPDLAQDILDNKVYQLSVDDLAKMTKELSSATAHEQMLEAQSKAFQSRGG